MVSFLLDEYGCDTAYVEPGVIGLIFQVHWKYKLMSKELSQRPISLFLDKRYYFVGEPKASPSVIIYYCLFKSCALYINNCLLS